MLKLLMTGATGFVGRNLTVYLEEQGERVVALSREAGVLNWQQVHSGERLPAFDAFIHLAGKAHDLKKVSAPEEYFEINTGLTIALFKQFLSGPARDFIYFSSVKAAADSVNGILDENVSPAPATPYGKSKLEAEQYILSQTLPAGKRVFILRPCMIHGPGNKGNLNLLYNFVQKGIPYPFAAFDNRRSFLSIDNLSFIVHQLLHNLEVPSGVYNLADDGALSTNELITLMAGSLHRTPRIWRVPRQACLLLAKVGDIARLPVNTERLNKLTESYVVSNQKIKQALQLEQLPVSTKEGLKRTLNSFIHE